ncbi:hypothetical protein CPC16_010411 [Podila verticillata]|nr:hypothetical protein CPC16_010411 [Podila verticillata]
MSALSRIPGLASLGAFVASAFTLHHPTIRRYNDLLANAFYHHGRLCASNQATVMVLVIIFVGIISYPGIVTSYNSSSYARMPTPPTLSSSRANMEAFWADVITPTWTQDTDLIGAQVSSAPPLHYVAPVIINASSIMQDRKGRPFSETDLLIFAAHVHQRIESIVVDYNAPDNHEGEEKRDGTPRYLSLKDICLQDKAEARCLVQSPLVHWRSDHLETDDTLDHILKLQNSSMASIKSSLFGRIATAATTHGETFDQPLQQEQQQEQQPTTASSLAITFFLRGDSTEGSNYYPKGVNVERVWKLIFDRLLHEWDASLQASLPHNMSLDRTDDRDKDYPESARVNHSPPTPSSRLADFSIDISSDIGKAHAGSRRLVSEEYAKPRSNISAEYWLLGMAYFVMFLYISLSVGRVDLVKSKYGLGIAAVATVFVSLLMSIGLCSVFGVTLTLMPWEILPFMIIVVGVENINILVHAVVETSMDLPVKERVGRGLGAVGVSITMTLIAELCLLIVGAMTTIPAVQEFCTFAIAAVIMDYLLQMSFFITVISIDIRRLELSDLSARPVAPLPRYPFSPRHTLQGGLHTSLAHNPRGPPSTTSDSKFKHQRSGSNVSNYSEGESKSTGKAKPIPKGRIFTSIIMVGVMTYLGYIYGTTSQTAQSKNVTVSFWHIQSSEFASEFWNMVDASNKGGYLEIYQPMVLTVAPFTSTPSNECIDVQEDDCDLDVHQDELDQRGKAVKLTNRQLDPRRPFKILRDALVIACLFVFWLVRVFVIPSIILAAAILLLLSYLLSPQRKLLVDLQWSFPFIVLPGDYQSKRKIMMEELLTQEARELGRDPGPSIPLPGTVDTLKMGGHETDIDQMDVATNGLVLTSSMDGTILLWSSVDEQVPIAQLESGPRTESMPTNSSRAPGKGSMSTSSSSHRSISTSVRCLQLDPSGIFAAAGYSDGSIRLWKIDTLKSERDTKWRGQVLSLSPMHQLDRVDDTDPARLRVSTIHFWSTSSSLIAGYRDGQVWNWDPFTGSGHPLVQSKHRGGIAELEVLELEQHTRHELGLQQRTYIVTAGKDGTIQCWGNSGLSPSNWTSLWQQPSLGPGIFVSVLSKDSEVPMITTGYSNGAIRIWDIEHGNLVWTLSRGTINSGPQSGYGQSSRRHSATALDHQPSHQGAVTKLIFKALELEDGLTGEPAPRIWLVISSGMDETVMVWMVEWEGLMSLPSDTQEFDPNGTSPLKAPLKRSLSQRELSHPMFHGRGAEPLGTLSSSLPAPRLVGFAKQRGGKSMAVGGTCLYGVRRRESPLAMTSTVPKQPHTSVSDFAGSGVNAARNRRKSSSQLTGLLSSSSSSKRGWEVWEADLYQCIFKDPGVWGLDLTVRSIDLQSSLPTSSGHQDTFYARRGSYFSLNRSSSEYEPFRAETGNSADSPVMVNSNGSGMAVSVSPSWDPHHPEMKAWLGSNIPKPQLRRRPGSSSQGQQGYVYSSYPQQPPTPGSEFGQFLFPTGSGRADTGSPWDPIQEQGREVEHELLPFVETRHIHVLPHHTEGKGGELSNVVVGFGNWIKIVRIQNDEEEEEEEGLHVYDYEG